MSWYNVFTIASRWNSSVKKSAKNASFVSENGRAATYSALQPEECGCTQKLQEKSEADRSLPDERK